MENLKVSEPRFVPFPHGKRLYLGLRLSSSDLFGNVKSLLEAPKNADVKMVQAIFLKSYKLPLTHST